MTSALSRVIVKIDVDKCNMCRLCVAYCPTYVFSVLENRIVADSSKCIECYGCVPLCPNNAIRIEVLNNTV